MLNMADELAYAGQIPYIYHLDKTKLLNAITSLAGLTTCHRENIQNTHQFFLTDPSCFRRYLNGMMDLVFEHHAIDEIHKNYKGKED